MARVDSYTYFENIFDRYTYRSDVLFWLLVSLHAGLFFAGVFHLVPMASLGPATAVLMLVAVSWVYTNARRRACNVIKAGFFALITLLYPIIGGLVYFIFRPKKLVITELPPAKMGVWPVFAGPVWIFARAPLRLLLKLALWLLGLAFLLISFLDMFGKI